MPYSLETIHPLFVHFPIALLSTGLLFDFFSIILSREDLEHGGFWCMLIGIISCLFANFTGIMAFLSEGSFELEGSFINLLNFTHFLLMWGATFIFAILFWVRIKYQLEIRYSNLKRNIYLFFNILAVGILFYASHLGAIGEREWLI